MTSPAVDRTVLDTNVLLTATAVANVRTPRTRLRLMAENSRVSERLLSLLDAVDCTSKQIHDANVVATMLVHGVDTEPRAGQCDRAWGGVVRTATARRDRAARARAPR